MGVRRFREPHYQKNQSVLSEGITYVKECQIKQISDNINILKKQTTQTASTIENIYEMVANLCNRIA
jgi:hypothetical protein